MELTKCIPSVVEQCTVYNVTFTEEEWEEDTRIAKSVPTSTPPIVFSETYTGSVNMKDIALTYSTRLRQHEVPQLLQPG